MQGAPTKIVRNIFMAFTSQKGHAIAKIQMKCVLVGRDLKIFH